MNQLFDLACSGRAYNHHGGAAQCCPHHGAALCESEASNPLICVQRSRFGTAIGVPSAKVALVAKSEP